MMKRVKSLRRLLTALLLLPLLLAACASATPTAAAPPMRLAFVRDGALWLRSGDRERKLAAGEAIHAPRFSPDGSFISYRDGSRFYVLDPRGTGPWEISDASSAAWSPRASILAIHNGRRTQTVTVGPDGPQPPRPVADGWIGTAWSPDGQRLAVSRAERRNPIDGTSWVGIVAAEGGPVREIWREEFPAKTDHCGAALSPLAWSPDSQYLLAIRPGFSSSVAADCNQWVVLPAAGGRVYNLGITPNPRWAAWSPTAPILALTDGLGRDAYWRKQIRLATAPWEGEPPSLTPEGYADREPAWHPSGRSLAFTRSRSERPENMNAPAPGQAIYQTDLAHPNPQPVPGSEGGFGPFYAKDGALHWFKAANGSIDLWREGRPLLKGLDLKHSYYGQWNWPQVLDWWMADLPATLGLEKVRGEWLHACIAHNLLKLHAAQTGPQEGPQGSEGGVRSETISSTT